MDLPLRWRCCTNPRKLARSRRTFEKRYPEDTSVQFSYLPALRALDALNQGDPAKALEMTQVATPYDLAVPGYSILHRLLLRSALSGLRAWSRLFPDGPPPRGSGGISKNSRSSGYHAERSDRTHGASPTGQSVVRFRRSREISRRLQGSPRCLEGRRSRYSGRPRS